MNTFFPHIFWPLLFSLGIVLLAALPAELVVALGCRNRGLVAACIAGSSGVLGVVAAFTAVVFRLRGRQGSERWMLSAALLALPLILLLMLA
ncbi:MAG: hypothetical protein QNJ17_08225 [Desulfocapsaceae bacterium]|nr:hypothetical protein [Desulfocapsaceae bacterium]